jgi:hypothetical protein
MEKCFNHYFKPSVDMIKPGKGDCSTCVPDENNKNCSEYQPIKITIYGFEVESDTEEKPTHS